jgi:hypothetical protein
MEAALLICLRVVPILLLVGAQLLLDLRLVRLLQVTALALLPVPLVLALLLRALTLLL